MKLDRVILSTNEDLNYFEFWPYVRRAWQKLFDVKVSLAVVTNRPVDDPWVQQLIGDGSAEDIVLFPEIEGIPTPNLAMVVRHILASRYHDEVCMINDIDLLPLQTAWYHDRLAKRESGQLLCIGAEYFVGGPDEGKFPMGWVTAEGRIWNGIVNPDGLKYHDLVKSWVGMRRFDHKEDISKTIWHEYKDAFADESLIRVWLDRWNKPSQIVHARWDYRPGIDTIDRARWNIDEDKLRSGRYLEAHMLRPFSKHKHQIEPLLNYLESL